MKKFRVNSSSDEKLVTACNKKTKKRCSDPKWLELEDTEHEPSPDTAVLIVDMRNAEDCVVKVYTTSDAEYVDTVGIDNKGYAVIIPWKPGLNIVCYGRCRVAEVTATEENST
ncbi:hypothetical protein LZ30DRAFT_594672 [Colletotrichum cereale]|nr:hypothetical protein LZ30DRAFT_594672 [Colletotrichum cereale]